MTRSSSSFLLYLTEALYSDTAVCYDDNGEAALSILLRSLAHKVKFRTYLGRVPDMILESLEADLRKALTCLHDPDYAPSELLRTITGCDDALDAECVRHAILQTLELLKPAADVPATARAWRIYELLSYRYLQDLTQEASAERLGITARHLRREQREAILVLARRLLERQEQRMPGKLQAAPAARPAEVSEWRAQVHQELAALRRSAPGSVADISEAVRGAIALGQTRAAKWDVALQFVAPQQNLIAAIHPSVLRQVMVMAISQLAGRAAGGAVCIETGRSGNQVAITVTGRPVRDSTALDSFLIQEILTAQDGVVELEATHDSLCYRITLPSADEIAVLVVDDNQDLVHFYRRYTAGSRYRIVHAPLGKEILSVVEAQAPGVIVLDVMLPDVDGWELLTHLHEHPTTRAVPVVVCSVIREPELALELGAALYLPKPVRRTEFLEALNRATAMA